MNDPLIDTTIGDYRILGRIGKGGMGVVYQARQVSLDRRVAVKVLRPEMCDDQEFVERFLREARAAANLNHPNIVQVMDAGMFRNFYFTVMEFVDGMNLRQIVVRDGPLPEAEALRYGHQAALALAYAHRNGVIHRDIKPDNLIVSREGVLKIGDLGLAKWRHKETGLTLTSADAIMGTPHYVPPEQIRNASDIDGRADIYALGLTLFYLLAGKPPFSAEDAAEVLAQHLSDPLPSLQEMGREVTSSTDRLIHAMGEKNRAKRIQTMEEAADAMAGILEDQFALQVAETPGMHLATPPVEPSGWAERFLATGVKGVLAALAGLFLALMVIVVYKFAFPPVAFESPHFTPAAPPADASRSELALSEPSAEKPVTGPSPETSPATRKLPATAETPKSTPPTPPAESPTPAQPLKPAVPEGARTEEASLAPTTAEPKTPPPSTPVELPPKTVTRELIIQGPGMIREWVIVSRADQWNAQCLDRSGAFVVAVAHLATGLDAKGLLRVNFMGQDSELWRGFLRKLPSCKRAVLELTPASVSADARDLSIEIHPLLQPWGMKPSPLILEDMGFSAYRREMQAETQWKTASASERKTWTRDGADGRGFDCENNALADIDDPNRTTFRMVSINPIRLNVLPDFNRLAQKFQESGKAPLHFGWVVQVSHGTGGVQFASGIADARLGPRLLMTFEEKAPVASK